MRFCVRLLSLLAALVLASGSSFAQAPKSQPERGPPFSVGGFRYELRPNDVHMFICEQPACGAQSRVSYRFYPPGNTMTLEQFRDEQAQIIKMLEQRSPGQTITILGIDGDSGTAVPRMFKARRLMVKPDGTKEYQVSGDLLADRGAASLISFAATEKASSDNYAQFLIGLGMVLMPKSR